MKHNYQDYEVGDLVKNLAYEKFWTGSDKYGIVVEADDLEIKVNWFLDDDSERDKAFLFNYRYLRNNKLIALVSKAKGK